MLACECNAWEAQEETSRLCFLSAPQLEIRPSSLLWGLRSKGAGDIGSILCRRDKELMLSAGDVGCCFLGKKMCVKQKLEFKAWREGLFGNLSCRRMVEYEGGSAQSCAGILLWEGVI